MIRTILSFCALFGSLLLVSKWLHESSRQAAAPAASPATVAPDSSPRAARPALSMRTPGGDIQLVSFEDEPTEEARDVRLAETPQRSVIKKAQSRAVIADDSPSTSESAGEEHLAPVVGPQDVRPAEPAIVLTPELIALRGRLRECLAYYYFRPENVAIRSPWGAMHAMIAYGVDSELIAGGQRVNAIGYLCYNGVCNGQQLFYTAGGKLQTRIGPGVQGHPGQFLAMLAQSKVKTDFPIRVGHEQFTVSDLIEHEKETCRPRTELTFKLIALTHYLPSDARWKSNDGQDWDIPRLIKEELAQPIVGAACGGTHRMTGFSYAVRKREMRGEPLTGQWLRAKKFVEDFHEYAFRLQNADGSFSTDWFAGRNEFGTIGKRLETTGHITEWLAFSLTNEQLVEPRMIKSVDYLTSLLAENRNEKWGIGPLGHGLHALALYDERVFGGKPGTRATELAAARQAALLER
jgi:hypothetical protein